MEKLILYVFNLIRFYISVIIDLDLDLLVTNGSKIQLLNIMSANNMDKLILK
jgi:hypothetical protein